MTDITPEYLSEHLEEYAEKMLTPDRVERFDAVLSNRLGCLTAGFEDLYDPHNVNACIRSCEVFGCGDVHVISIKNQFQTNHGTAKNATRWVDVNRYDSTEGCISALQSKGVTVIGTLPEGDAVPYTDFELPDKLCILMGREATGLSDEAIERCDAHVTIPQYGFTQSLNISVALAILLQHFSARYRESGRAIGLSAEDKKRFRRSWLERDLFKKFGWPVPQR